MVRQSRKFEVTSSNSFEDMIDRMPIRDLGHAHFYGTFFLRPLVIPHIKPCTVFEVSSSSSFWDIDAAMVDM